MSEKDLLLPTDSHHDNREISPPGEDWGDSPPNPVADQDHSGFSQLAQEFVYYKRRWYILFVYSMMAFTQSLSWNTWGPIASSAKYAYGWDNGMISLLVSWGPIMFMLTVFPFSYVIETKGTSTIQMSLIV